MTGLPIHRPVKHSWSEPNRAQFKTERHCLNCGLVKITDHSNPDGSTFTRWWRADFGDIASQRTPQCPPRAEKTAA